MGNKNESSAGETEETRSSAANQEENSQSASPGRRADMEGGAANEPENPRAERDELRDRLARMQAEFENARKRAIREQQQFKDFALADALKSLLPILDSLDRALQSPTQDLKTFRDGVELIRQQLQEAMERLGLRQVPAQGERFDPTLHEAIEALDADDATDNYVTEELQRGFKLGGRLLRPAMVRVVRDPKNEAKK